jgi:hypothetical protein
VTAQGAKTLAPNKILKDDKDEPVTVTVPLYEGALAGERIQLFWSGVEVPEAEGGVYSVDGTEGDDFTVTFSVAWSFVNNQGNNAAALLHYQAHDAISQNFAVSGPQAVHVYIQDIVVPDPVIQNLHPDYGNLYCGSMVPDEGRGMAAVVFIPPDPNFANTGLKIEYQAYADPDGLVELPVGDTFSHVISEQESIDGAYIKIPYELFKQTGSAFGAIKYRVTIGEFTTTSSSHFVRVLMMEGDGTTCKFDPSP